jgi:hypothetical protein
MPDLLTFGQYYNLAGRGCKQLCVNTDFKYALTLKEIACLVDVSIN